MANPEAGIDKIDNPCLIGKVFPDYRNEGFMQVELIRSKTADGVLLDGCLQSPDSVVAAEKRTVWLLIHGTGGSFYSPGVLQTFAEHLVGGGQSVARINTRGHDIVTANNIGAAFESIADCIHDLRAWLEWLVRRGFSEVVLVGHSMGGVKAVFSQAHDPHPNVLAVVGVSPPRFCYSNWQSSPQAGPFRDHFRRATELVEDGRGDELMVVEQPLPMWLTAAAFLAKYGPHDEYDFIPLLPRLTCPTLLIIGTGSVESSPAFESTPAAIADLAKSQPRLSLQLVPGANTGYSRHLDVPVRLAREWFASVASGSG